MFLFLLAQTSQICYVWLTIWETTTAKSWSNPKSRHILGSFIVHFVLKFQPHMQIPSECTIWPLVYNNDPARSLARFASSVLPTLATVLTLQQQQQQQQIQTVVNRPVVCLFLAGKSFVKTQKQTSLNCCPRLLFCGQNFRRFEEII